MKSEERKEKMTLSGFIVAISIIFMVIGLAMMFMIPDYVTVKQICYVIAMAILVIGISLIVRYFLREEFRNPHEYDFSIGVLFVIVGSIALIRATPLSENFPFALGVLMLFAAILKLQMAMDLRALHDRGFSIWLFITIIFTVCAVVIILNPFSSAASRITFTEYAFIADGAITFIDAVYVYFRIKASNKKIEKEKEEAALAMMQKAPEPEQIEEPKEEAKEAEEENNESL